MKIYVYYEGDRLVGSAKKPRHYIAYGESEDYTLEQNCVHSLFDSMRDAGLIQWKGHWDITDRLRDIAWKTGEPVRI